MAGNSGEFVSVVEKNARKEVQDLIKTVEELKKGINKAGESFKNIKVPSQAKSFVNELNGLLKQNNILLEQQLRLNNTLAQSTERVANARANNNQRTQQEITNNRLLAANAARAAQANSTFANSYERLSAQQNIAARRVQDLIARGRTAEQSQKQYNRELRTAQADFDRLNARVLAADRAVGRFNRNVGNYPRQAAQGIRDFLGAFGLVTGVALLATMLRDVFNEIKSFDRQLIAVGKTTNITGDQLKQLGQDVIDLGVATEGVNINGLLKSAEIAGQLGVKGTENILKFSLAIEKLKLTSNIISDEQVQNFAKFIEVSADSFENADRLASVITQLGNNFATTEAEILANATEIAKGTAVYNSSADSILGVAAATSSLGSEAEASRSAIQSTFNVINRAISLGENLSDVLQLTGLSEKELADQFNTDAAGVFLKLVAGLSKAKKEGQNLGLVLDKLGLSEKRTFTVVGALAANYNLLEKSVNTANKEYKDNVALNTEVEAASKSISSILSDINDEWDAYILNTNEANSGTSTITDALIYLRDNLTQIIGWILKGAGAWATYKLFAAAAQLQAWLMTQSLSIQTAAQATNTTATAANTVAVAANVVAVEADTVAEAVNTVASEANTIAEAENTVGVAANTVAQVANTTATNIASAAWGRFSAILKANALGLAIAAVAGLIYWISKMNVSVEEQEAKLKQNQEGVKKNTAEFIKNRDVNQQNAEYIKRLSDRYDDLTGKTKLNSKEQVELNNILAALGKTVPAAISKMDKYGNALAINTAKTKEYIAAKRELYERQTNKELKKNQELLNQYQKEAQVLNVTEKEVNGLRLQGVGFIKRRNDVLVVQNTVTRNWRTLTDEERTVYLKARLANEDNIAKTKQAIEVLKNRLGIQTELNKATGNTSPNAAPEAPKADPRDVTFIEKLIKEQKDLLDKSTTRDEAKPIQAKIKALEAEKVAILGVTETTKKRQKIEVDYLADVFNLRKQNIEYWIESEDRIMNDEEVNYQKRIAAANNYFFKRNTLNQQEYSEAKRLEDLDYANQVKAYKENIKEGSLAASSLTSLHYSHILKKELIDEEYLSKKTNIEIESAKKLQGVLESIQDQASVNTIEERQLAGLVSANKLLYSIRENGDFTALENSLMRINEDQEDAEQKILGIELKRVQAEKERIIARNQQLGQNESIVALENKELQLKKDILKTDNDRLKAIADVRSETQRYLNELSQSRVSGFFDEMGFSGLSTLFDKVEYEIIDSAGNIEKRVGSTFQKIQDQAHTAAANIRMAAKAALDSGAINVEQYKSQMKQANKVEFEGFKASFNLVTDLTKDLYGFINQNRQANTDAELAELDRNYSIRMKFANGNAEAEQELARQLEEQKREIRIREAKADKEAALFNAIISTASAVVSALPNVVLAALVGALGAAQIAMIASRPIPAYAEGTDNHIGGKAIVGDGGRHEVIQTPDGKLSITPNKSTLVDLPKGTKVYPDIASSGLLSNGLPNVVMNNIAGLTESDMQRVMDRTLAKMPVNVMTADKRGLNYFAATAAGKRHDANNRAQFKGKRIG